MQKKKQTKTTNKKTQANAAKKSASAGKRGAPPAKAKESGLFKFRRYKKNEGGRTKKAKHPKLIVDEEQDEYGFMGLTESEKRGHHKNIRLSKNPQKDKTGTAYLRDELRYDSKTNFGKILEDYNLSEEDKIAVIEYIKKRKKKK